jgi:hypothetical protein
MGDPKVIDNEKLIAEVKIALAALETDMAHGNRVTVSLSNRLYDEPKFVALVVATYQHLIGDGLTSTNIALTICLGIMIAQGGAAFALNKKPTPDIEIPPGTLLQ